MTGVERPEVEQRIARVGEEPLLGEEVGLLQLVGEVGVARARRASEAARAPAPLEGRRARPALR